MEQTPVNVFAKWEVKDGHLDKVLSAFTQLVEKTRQEEGNLFYKVYQSNTEPNTLMLYEGYRDEAAVATHRTSEHFQTIALGQIIPVLQNREVILATQLF